MGTWICHLRIAENLLKHWPHLDPVAFAFGNIAPDSGRANADRTAFDPPKEVTHFHQAGDGRGRCGDMIFYREYLQAISPDNLADYSFALGYFCHLICDNMWSRRPWAASLSAYADEMERDGKWTVVDKIKTDWYGLDQRYVRDHPDSLFWQIFLVESYPQIKLPFLIVDAVHESFDYIRKFYSEPDSDWVLDRPYPYLNETTMQRIVDDSTAAILQIMAALPEVDLGESYTSLVLLEKSAVSPYELPLGDIAG